MNYRDISVLKKLGLAGYIDGMSIQHILPPITILPELSRGAKQRWFNVCGGGCAYERFVVNKTFNGLHPECALRQKLYPYMIKKLTQIELNS